MILIVRVILKISLLFIRTSLRFPRILKILLLFILLGFGSIYGFQGILQTSFGARQAGMGGAFQAVGGSIMDLESNPSHLSRFQKSKSEFGSAFHFAQIEYSDSFMDLRPDYAYSNQITQYPKAILPYLGYVSKVTDRLGIGVALYSQGGGGGTFSKITRLAPEKKTLNETLGLEIPVIGGERKIQEDMVFKFMVTKATIGFGYKFDRFAIGAGVDLVYSFMQMKKVYRDETRSLELPGSIRYSSDPSYTYGGKLGISYELTERIRIAYSYTLRNVLHLDGRMNVESLDPGKSFDARVSRFMSWPDRHIFGISYRNNAWILDFDVKFVPWSEHFKTSKFVLEHSWIETPLGTETNTMQMNFRWRDQYSFALGAEYIWSRILRIRTGYSYGKSPVTDRGLSPMLGSTNEHHIAGGIGYYWKDCAFQLAMEYGFPKRMNGSLSSDWSLSHSVFSINDVSLQSFQFEKSMSVFSLYFGFELNT
ncbi:outer membrane protein transport protein [Leptospira sp. 201903071]|uniref:OmpP1/FadL family transporter n=1 Tax=Leptospira ainazelensis TaxID=2810034 RepID=UPI0019654A18|nr:outer membrane protein transport protein [Leptospira ainazelensis]MBM9502086.1 outer membrane protein transport protein [Leptospira ainazelensis]